MCMTQNAEILSQYRRRVAYGEDPVKVREYLEGLEKRRGTSQVWRVSWSKKLYDYQRIISEFREGTTQRILQSKGMAKMRNIPRPGDIAYITCAKKRLMKCIVETDFQIDNREKNDACNLGETRRHTDNDTYLKMRIVEVYNNPIELRGVQRTWSKYPGL